MGEKKRRRREEEKRREKEEEIQLRKFLIHVWNISFVWNSRLEHLFCLELLDLLVRKPP